MVRKAFQEKEIQWTEKIGFVQRAAACPNCYVKGEHGRTVQEKFGGDNLGQESFYTTLAEAICGWGYGVISNFFCVIFNIFYSDHILPRITVATKLIPDEIAGYYEYGTLTICKGKYFTLLFLRLMRVA